MDWWGKLGLGLSAGAAGLGLTQTPLDDAARLAHLEALSSRYQTWFPTVPEVTAAQLAQRLDQGEPLVLVDVRTAAERAISTLPGAIPAEVVARDLDAYRGQQLVAYCTIGVRSGEWAEEQRAKGLDVRNLRGSILAWTYLGRDLVDPEGAPVRRLHVYGAAWDLARTDYAAVW